MTVIKIQRITGFEKMPINGTSPFRPQPSNSFLPRNFYSFIACGIRGSGKTYSIVQLIHYQEKFLCKNELGELMDNRTIVFCPTFKGNPIYLSLKSLDVENDVHPEYSHELLKSVIIDIQQEYQLTCDYQKMKTILQKYSKSGEKSLSTVEYELLAANDFQLPAAPKYPNGVMTHMIFDDLLATDAFSKGRSNPVKGMVTNGRHYRCNVYFATQSFNAMPAAIRTNSEVLAFYKFMDSKETDKMYQGVSNLLTKEQFLDLFEFATEYPHDYMLIDTTQPDIKRRIRRYVAPRAGEEGGYQVLNIKE